MAGIEVSPMQDALVVENAVSKVANVEPPFVESRLVLSAGWGVREGVFGKMGADTGAGMRVVEETGPEAKIEFRHDSSGSERFASLEQGGLDFRNLVLLPRGESRRSRVIPSVRAAAGGKLAMHGVAKGDLRKLERRIERLAERHVEEVTGEGGGGICSVTPIGIQALGVNNALDPVKESRIHFRQARRWSGISIDMALRRRQGFGVDLGIPSSTTG